MAGQVDSGLRRAQGVGTEIGPSLFLIVRFECSSLALVFGHPFLLLVIHSDAGAWRSFLAIFILMLGFFH